MSMQMVNLLKRGGGGKKKEAVSTIFQRVKLVSKDAEQMFNQNKSYSWIQVTVEINVG